MLEGPRTAASWSWTSGSSGLVTQALYVAVACRGQSEAGTPISTQDFCHTWSKKECHHMLP